jgi:hypothetical protein
MRHALLGPVVLTLVVFASLGGGVHADTLVVSPSTQTNVEGDTDNGFPFNLSNFAGDTSMRYQQVYAASQFSSVGSNMEITGITFRPDATFGAAYSSTLSNIRIDLSTTSAPANALSTTFANNIGSDDKIVFSGALSTSSSFTGPAAGPKNFDIHINFTTPFVYNPANGNLLLEVLNFAGGGTTQFDADQSSHDSLGSRLFAINDANATTGTQSSIVLITQFDFVPAAPPAAVPEPSTFALLALGGGALAGWRRWRKRRTA